MRLLYLVEEHHAVGPAAYLLRKLAGLVIADISRGRADDARDGEFLHKFAHVEPYQALRRIEEVRRQALDELRLAHARAADEDEADRLALGLQPHAGALYRGADGVDGLVLAHDVLAQAVAQPGQALKLVGRDVLGRYLRPELDDAGQVLARERGGRGLQPVELLG